MICSETYANAVAVMALQVIALVERVSPKIKAPLVLFTYYNPIRSKGLESYMARIKKAGAAGLLVPDLPLEGTQTEGIQAAARAAGIELVLLATPTTPVERMKMIAEQSEGFVYLVSVTGVTGVRAKASDRVQGLIEVRKEEESTTKRAHDDTPQLHTQHNSTHVHDDTCARRHMRATRHAHDDTCARRHVRTTAHMLTAHRSPLRSVYARSPRPGPDFHSQMLKGVTDKPIGVGFGVSGAEQASKIAGWGADGVIAGSAFVKRLGESGSPEAGLASLKELAIELRGALPLGK